MSQPALSASVKSLERELGVQLFNRSSRQVEITAAGRVFVEEARDFVAHADRLLALVRKSAVESSGLLSIGYSPSFNLGWLCSLISRMNRDRESPVNVTPLSAESTRLCDLLLNRELQAVFLPGRIAHPELRCEALFREELLVVYARNHPLAAHSGLSLGDITNEPVVWLRHDSEPWLYDSFIESCAQRGYHPAIRQEVTSFHECAHFARELMGITFLPSSIRLACHGDSIASASVSDDGMYMESSLLSRADSPSAGLDHLMRLVRHHVLEEAPFYSLHSLLVP